MDTVKLNANHRTDMSNSRMKKIRREGYATGTVYGHGAESIPVEVNLLELRDQLRASDAKDKALIDLRINGAPEDANGVVVIKEFSKDPLTRKVQNIQFQRVFMKEKLNTKVQIAIVGDAAGTLQGGTLEQITNELQISSLPMDIPSSIEVDVSGLGIGGHIRVGDLQLSAGIDILTDADTIVATCVAPHVAVPTEGEGEASSTAAAPAEE
jgi:large subunit ribosomal protein L25